MVEKIIDHLLDDIAPDISHIITEDDEPVDNITSSKNQRCLVNPLYDSNVLARPFFADVNVGVFYSPSTPPLVPDMFLSLGVEPAKDWWEKKHRSYFVWEFQKPPDVVVEIVSNLKGDELDGKKKKYAQMGVHYYIVYDPQMLIQNKQLQVFENYVGEFLPRPDHKLPRIGLSLSIWHGVFEDREDDWLRWCTIDGVLLLTGREQAEQERQRAEQERQRSEILAAKLRELGIDPATL